VSNDLPQQLRVFIAEQTRFLDAIIDAMSNKISAEASDESAQKIVMLMSQGLGVTMHSILKLTSARDMSIRDCYGMARGAFELAVNTCYITAGGAEVADRAQRHAMQKTYRDLHRKGEIGNMKFELGSSDVPDIQSIPGLEAALAEYSRKGKEVTDWTPVSISERISVVSNVDSAVALCLSGASMSIYRHSSELLHGTYFSVVYFWSGSGAPASTRERFEKVWEEHFITIFTAVFFSASAVIKLLSRRFCLSDIVEADKRMSVRVKAILDGQSEGGNANIVVAP
jgi:hypothetical protein